MLIEASRSLLLIVDVQERLAPAMTGREDVVRNCTILMRAAGEMKVPQLLSEQYPQGLGHTLAELAELASPEDIYGKVEFSCPQNAPLKERLATENRDQIVIAGIEAHVCVLQSAFDLIADKRDVFIVADAVASRRPESKELALQRMRDAGIATVTTEMVVFEWLRAASSPAFKTLSKLIC